MRIKKLSTLEEIKLLATPMKVVMDATWPWPISVVSKENDEYVFAEWDSYCSTQQATPQQVLEGEGADWDENDKQEAAEYHQMTLVSAHLFANSLDMLKVLDRLVKADAEGNELGFSIAVDEATEILARFSDLTPEFVTLEDN